MKKRSLIFAICFAAVSAFAGGRNIDSFDAKDAGTPDDYITAEFGGKLKVAKAGEVKSVQKGRIILRQKFMDPFEEDDATYQLYQGGAGDLSSMSAMSAEGVDYSDLVNAKIYKRSGMNDNADVEKVYFDGKFVYVPGTSKAVAYVDGSEVNLVGEGGSDEEDDEDEETTTAAASAGDEECDDNDEDCEEEFVYKTTANVDNTEADEKAYAASNAAADVGDRFGIADEVRFWSAVGLSAVAAVSIVAGVLQHMEASKAKDEYDQMSELYNGITSVCKGQAACIEKFVAEGQANVLGSLWTVGSLVDRMKENKKTQDSYTSARNIWFGVAGASIAGAVILFVW